VNLKLAPTLLLLVVLGACSNYQERTRPYRPATEAAAEDGADGERLFQRDCGWCHGSDGAGTNRGPSLLDSTNGPALTHFVLTTGRMPLNFPQQRVQRTEPAYDDASITEIVEYVESLGQSGPDIPEPDLEEAELHLGLELYQENCAACHSTSGVGGALATGDEVGSESYASEPRANIAPDIDASTPTEIAEAMITGPGTMPVFGNETFSDEEIDSVVRYVVYLQQPDNRGGAPVGGVGPVAEGAIAWTLGIGLLLGVARLLGTRSGKP
jgi:ubiquinol-cytochrome c reductase cytochrome c subunit